MAISINPPPRDMMCECCDKHISELTRFGKAGNKNGAFLIKNFREFYGWISASWECRDCFGLSKEDYLKERQKDELARVVEEKLKKDGKKKI